MSGTVVPASPFLVFLRRVKCLMRRHLARPCSLSHDSLHAHASGYGYVLSPRATTFENRRGVELYDAAVSSSALPAPPLLSIERMMRRRLAQPYPLSLSFLPPHAVVRGLGLSRITFGVGRRLACMIPQRLSPPCPHPLYSLPAHAVEYWSA